MKASVIAIISILTTIAITSPALATIDRPEAALILAATAPFHQKLNEALEKNPKLKASFAKYSKAAVEILEFGGGVDEAAAIEKLNKAQKPQMLKLIEEAGIKRADVQTAVRNVFLAVRDTTKRGYDAILDDGLNVIWTIKQPFNHLDPEMNDQLPPQEVFAARPFAAPEGLALGSAGTVRKEDGNYVSYANASMIETKSQVTGIGQMFIPLPFYKRLLVFSAADTAVRFMTASPNGQSINAAESRTSLFHEGAEVCGMNRDHGNVVTVSMWAVNHVVSAPFNLDCDIEIAEPRMYIAKTTTETYAKAAGPGNAVNSMAEVLTLSMRIKAYLPK